MKPAQEMETKIFNSAALIIVIYLKAMIVFNLILGQYLLSIILLATSAIVLVFYLIGKSKKNFRWGINLLALLGYPILAINFFYNDGIQGPTFYIFLMVHIIILSVTQIKTYWFWGAYNFIFFLGLFYIDAYYPDLIAPSYPSPYLQFIDHAITYFACIIGIIAIVTALKWNYQKQKLESEQKGNALKTAIGELSSTNEQKNKIIALISHDLKNPLLSITTILEMINEGELDKAEMEAVLKELYIIANNAQKMSEEILEWATLELKNTSPKFRKVNLKEYCDSMLLVYKGMARQKNIVLDTQFGGDAVIVTDLDRLMLIVRNLLQNAIKFTSEEGKILFSCQKTEEEFVITVEDTGKGIPKERLQRLFNMKFVTTSGTSMEKGTGVGLYISNENAKKIGGSLSVKSELGRGSIFTLKLPITPSKSKQNTS
ncbi:sensor histidine kinase [Echinicola rosea]|nr:HAMP domain-containing sensor histidine kinase [Echinicola rosea]